MKNQKKSLSPYYTDLKVKERIDTLLFENAKIWSNIGTGSSLDVVTRKEGEKQWKLLAKEIKSLDKDYYNIVCPYGIDS